MISVCIPVYNLDVRELVQSLLDQAEALDAEIILIDDASREEFRELNRSLKDRVSIYHELEQNIGRSRIRNLFLEYASKPNLLFLDCDSVMLNDTFLNRYSEQLKTNTDRIICGGMIYQSARPESDRTLHWKYGKKKESKPAEIRSQHPNRSFMTINFLVTASLLKEIPFNENILGYGHEDSLLGYELEQKGHSILHINNPVLHGGLQTNQEFISKTAEAVKNLVLIEAEMKEHPGFSKTIKLSRTYGRMRSGLAGRALLRLLGSGTPFWRWLLNSGWNSLKLLDAYKLGLYSRLKNKKGPLQ